MFKTILACVGGVWVAVTAAKLYGRYERGKLEEEYRIKEDALKTKYADK